MFHSLGASVAPGWPLMSLNLNHSYGKISETKNVVLQNAFQRTYHAHAVSCLALRCLQNNVNWAAANEIRIAKNFISIRSS